MTSSCLASCLPSSRCTTPLLGVLLEKLTMDWKCSCTLCCCVCLGNVSRSHSKHGWGFNMISPSWHWQCSNVCILSVRTYNHIASIQDPHYSTAPFFGEVLGVGCVEWSISLCSNLGSFWNSSPHPLLTIICGEVVVRSLQVARMYMHMFRCPPENLAK